jgi:hypothetical protein
MGALYEAAGEPARADSAYALLLSRWPNADGPALREVQEVEKLRAGLASKSR